jgi:hypothetical protein
MKLRCKYKIIKITQNGLETYALLKRYAFLFWVVKYEGTVYECIAYANNQKRSSYIWMDC